MGRAGIWTVAIVVGGCGTQVYRGEPPEPAYTYYEDVKPVLDQHCTGCHADESESVPLATYAEAYLFRDVVRDSILDGTMPPADEASRRSSLSEDETRTVLGWVEAGGLMGDPGTADVD
jgi:hypothetical protein